MQITTLSLKTLVISTFLTASALASETKLPEAMTDLDREESEYVGDYELDTLMPEILKFGYQEVQFKSYGDAVEGAKKDLICPDYEARTGNKTDCNALIEIAAIPLTGGTNDLIAISHLDGDCDENGCKAFYYKNMAGGQWVKLLTFINSGGVAYKFINQGTLITAVGLADQKANIKTWLYKENGFTELIE